MDNQHRKIKGYRELSQGEIDLMNEIKAKGQELEVLIAKVQAHVKSQRVEVQKKVLQTGDALTEAEARTASEEADSENCRLNAAEPERWASVGKTHFQEGLMALTRAVAQPTFF